MRMIGIEQVAQEFCIFDESVFRIGQLHGVLFRCVKIIGEVGKIGHSRTKGISHGKVGEPQPERSGDGRGRKAAGKLNKIHTDNFLQSRRQEIELH
jgi:hypothetical protein